MKKVLKSEKGMAISGILYTLLVLFLALLFGILGLVTSGKNALERVKKDVYVRLNNSYYEQELVKTKYPDGSSIYFNPQTWTKCNDYVSYNSRTLVKEGCMKWYAFNDDEDATTLNILLDHNTTALAAWNSTSNNSNLNYISNLLNMDTSTWKIKNARLITANEVAKITKADSIIGFESINKNGTAKWFYLDGKDGKNASWQEPITSSKIRSSYAWLFDNLYSSTSYGGRLDDNKKYSYDDSSSQANILGYWTSSKDIFSRDLAWYIQNQARLYYGRVDYAYRAGIRPVITIDKILLQ